MCLLSLSLFAAEPVREEPRVTTTEHFDFAPGGTIKIERSSGCLSVEGWDQPQVEVTVIRLMSGFYTGKAQEQVLDKLRAVTVKSDRRSNTELNITTEMTRQHRWLRVPLSSESLAGVDLEYEIRVPRDSHLVIHHGSGSVIITGVSGGIEASAVSGDVIAMLPDPGPYVIDAKTRLGTIYSDFGNPGHLDFIGERFASAANASAKRVVLRNGIGGISIQEITSGGY